MLVDVYARALTDRIADLEAQLEAVGAGGVGAMMPRHAQPAPAVVDQTPVAVVDEDEDGLFADLETEIGVVVKRGDKLYAAPQPQQIAEPASEAYDMIDHFLRNNLDDTDYAEYSQALDSILSAPKEPS